MRNKMRAVWDATRALYVFLVRDYPGFLLYILSAAMVLFIPIAWAMKYRNFFGALIYYLIFLMVVEALWIYYKFTNFRKYTTSLKRLVLLFAETTFGFAALYMVLVFLDPDGQFSGFGYYSQVFTKDSKSDFLDASYLKDVVRLMIDTVHFSIVTAATVGYGDISPQKHIAKLIVDSQIVYSFIIAVIGIGQYSEQKSQTNHSHI